ncbi:DNA-binding protein, partial [Escherichia coli]
RAALPINQEEKNSKRTVNLFAIFLKTIRNAEKYVQMTK